MSGTRRRLERLEAANRERAVGLMLAFWRGLTVEECALVLAGAKADEDGGNPPPGAAEIDERGRAELEPPLRAAIGWHEGMPDEEEVERIGRLLDGLDLFGTREGEIKRQYLELVGGG